MTANCGPLTMAVAPRLSAHVRLHFDKVRGRWVVLADECCYVLDDTAAKLLGHCDGSRSLAAIITENVQIEDEAACDALAILQDLFDKGIIAVSL